MMAPMPQSDSDPATPPRHSVCVLILTVALVLRLAWLAATYALPAVSDEHSYWSASKTYAEGRGTAPPYLPPGLPLFGAALVRVFGDSVNIMRLAMCLVGVMNVWLVNRTARVAFGESAALWAMGIAAVFPPWIFLSSAMLSQTLSATFTLAAAWASLCIVRSKRIGYAVPMGSATGLGALVRPSLLPMAGIGVLVCLFALRNRRGVGGAALVTLATAVPILPLTALNYRASGEPVLISLNNGWNLYAGNNPDTHWYGTWLLASDASLRDASPAVAAARRQTEDLRGAHRYKALSSLARRHIVDHPIDFGVRVLSRLRTFWGFDTFTPAKLRAVAPQTWSTPKVAVLLGLNAGAFVAVMVLAILAIGMFEPGIPRFSAVILAGLVAANMAAYLVAFAHPTYHFACMGPLFMLAAGPLRTLWSLRLAGVRELLGRWTKCKLVLIVALLAIQVEWLLFMARRF